MSNRSRLLIFFVLKKIQEVNVKLHRSLILRLCLIREFTYPCVHFLRLFYSIFFFQIMTLLTILNYGFMVVPSVTF